MRCIIDDLRRILDDNIYGILEMRVNIMKKIAIIGLGYVGLPLAIEFSRKNYVLGFDVTTDKDLLFTIEGIPCCIETSHQIYLYGMQIDWQGGLNSRGFTFTNPNASSTCGCGTSFAV